MSLGKRLSGLILVGLGAIGIAVCLAGIVGVWIAASRLQQVNSRVFRQVDLTHVGLPRLGSETQAANLLRSHPPKDARSTNHDPSSERHRLPASKIRFDAPVGAIRAAKEYATINIQHR